MLDYPKVTTGTRLLAALIDGVISWAVGFIPIIGAIIGVIYMLIKDGLFEGQSIGKNIMKLQVVTENGVKADYMVSVKRNLIFAIPLAIMIIPVAGWFIAPIAGLVIFIIEVLKLLNDPNGRRIGDNWAGTQVIMMQEKSQISKEA